MFSFQFKHKLGTNHLSLDLLEIWVIAQVEEKSVGVIETESEHDHVPLQN